MIKKILGGVAICAVLAILFPISIPAPTYTYVVKELAQTFSSLMTFTSGLTANGPVDLNSTVTIDGAATGTGSMFLDGNVGVAAGSQIGLEGSAGNTYVTRDSDTGCIQEWKDGTLGWQLCNGYAVPPECPSDLSTVAFGGLCRNLSTGKILYRGTLEAMP